MAALMHSIWIENTAVTAVFGEFMLYCLPNTRIYF